MYVITYPYWDLSKAMLVKGATSCVFVVSLDNV